MSWVEIAALLPLLFWSALLLDRRRRWPPVVVLPEGEPLAAPVPLIAVVPARNEAATLPSTLPALLSQAPGLRVVIVDDGSDDATAAAARRAAEAHDATGRLRVVDAGSPPPGWSGKVWALDRGVRAAAEWAPEVVDGGWLLFSDADIRLRPGAVRDLLAVGADPHRPRDLVSVMARLRAERFAERLLIPAFVFFFHLLYPFRAVADDASRVSAAAGGCLLLRASLLRRVGGLEAIRSAVIDDLALARRAREAGGRLWLGLDPGIESVRSYRGWSGVWRMVTRTAFVQLRCRLSLLVATVTALVVFAASPPFLLAAGAVLHLGPLAAAPLSPARAVVWSFLAWALEAAALRPAVRHHRIAASYAWSLPFASLAYAAMTVASAWHHLRGHGSRWKGRAYRTDPDGS